MKACPSFKRIFGSCYAEGRIYCLAESVCHEPSTYLDLNQDLQVTKDMQHPASRLLFKGEKERMAEDNRYPEVHVIPVDAFVGPAIVFRDFCPMFRNTKDRRKGAVIEKWTNSEIDRSMRYLILRPHRQWSSLFQSMARDKFGNTNKVVPDFIPYLEKLSSLHSDVKKAKAESRVLKKTKRSNMKGKDGQNISELQKGK